MMTPDDLAQARAWIGRTQTYEDIVAPHHAAAFRATLAPYLADDPSGAAPLGLHWCLAYDIAETQNLDADGHAKRGAFLPPCPLPKRMAAGGELEIRAPLKLGAVVTRTSRIDDVSLREGRSGQLCFVAITHEFASDGAVALIEKQSLVFRGEGSSAAPSAPDEEEAEVTKRLNAGTALLFRYSALTFNAHRIHYDRSYAAEEGYPGLVVHGPLQATLLLNLAAELLGRTPRRFVFRAQSPIVDGPFEIGGRVTGEGACAVWTRNAQGGRAMSATASV